MDVTQRLVRLFQVDKQLRGLQSRLKTAEKFLAEQERQLSGIEAKRTASEAHVKQFTAAAKNLEGETARLDEKVTHLRQQMETAKTNKEYKAFLTEVNTFKAERDRAEQTALEHMTKADELKAELAKLNAEKAERERVRAVALQDRDTRAHEIKDRLAELKSQRQTLTDDIPKPTLGLFERLIETRGDEAMATVEIIDRKRHEFSCGSCQMGLPVDSVSGLMGSGKLTMCVSCGCILFIDEEVAKQLQPAPAKR